MFAYKYKCIKPKTDPTHTMRSRQLWNNCLSFATPSRLVCKSAGQVRQTNTILTSKLAALLSNPNSTVDVYQNNLRKRSFSWQGHGTDLLSDSLAHNYGVPKIILNGHSSSGFDVVNMVKNMDPNDESLKATGGIVHCTGSILAFPGACFLWNVRKPEDLTMESLAPVLLYQPRLEYLFIGCSTSIPPHVIQSIKQELQKENINMVIEPMDLTNAMGTFNILNGEDRLVAAALILPPDDDN
mmetsp:Transcript_30716/g.57504  ORF Transcript_30716/g.57504 Transcript_30716/m.57504 type:complete len:241 (+) Transcript_30716:40-762(+)